MINRPQLQPFLGGDDRQQERDEFAARMQAEFEAHQRSNEGRPRPDFPETLHAVDGSRFVK